MGHKLLRSAKHRLMPTILDAKYYVSPAQRYVVYIVLCCMQAYGQLPGTGNQINSGRILCHRLIEENGKITASFAF